MALNENLQLLRKQKGYSQEQLAERIGIARQTISKWESGQAVPELAGLTALSEVYGVTIDRMVKEGGPCDVPLRPETELGRAELADFLVLAKRNTYAAQANQARSSRPCSHDFRYEGASGYTYYDTYLGGTCFTGAEAVWRHGAPVWGMNYAVHVTGEPFDPAFLKEALLAMPREAPFRGPEIYTRGDYLYHCKVDGAISWFQGYEEIFYMGRKTYECRFHGGSLR